MKSIIALLSMLVLSGCANQRTLYDWGGYNGMLYESYKKPDTTAANLQKLQEHIAKLEKGSVKIAPGLYADLGTLYLQAGDRTRAIESYRKERAAWQESAGLMDAMIKNLTSAKTTPEVKS